MHFNDHRSSTAAAPRSAPTTPLRGGGRGIAGAAARPPLPRTSASGSVSGGGGGGSGSGSGGAVHSSTAAAAPGVPSPSVGPGSGSGSSRPDQGSRPTPTSGFSSLEAELAAWRRLATHPSEIEQTLRDAEAWVNEIEKREADARARAEALELRAATGDAQLIQRDTEIAALKESVRLMADAHREDEMGIADDDDDHHHHHRDRDAEGDVDVTLDPTAQEPSRKGSKWRMAKHMVVWQARALEAEAAIIAVTEHAQKVDAQLAKANSRVTELEAALAQAGRKDTEVTQQMAQQMQELQHLREQHEARMNELGAAKNEVAAATLQREDDVRTLQRMEEELQSARARMASMSTSMPMEENESNPNNNHTNTIAEEGKVYQQRVALLEGRCQLAETRVAHLEAELQSVTIAMAAKERPETSTTLKAVPEPAMATPSPTAAAAAGDLLGVAGDEDEGHYEEDPVQLREILVRLQQAEIVAR